MPKKLVAGRIEKPAPSGITCTICKQAIVAGETSIHYTTQKWRWAHLACYPERSHSVVDKESGTEEELRREQQNIARASGDKRRRTGGHGYSGGDGFTDL